MEQCGATLTLARSRHTLARARPLSLSRDDEDDLPDGSCFRRTLGPKNQFNPRTQAIRPAKYLGSFPVNGPDQTTRAELMKKKLQQLRRSACPKPVLLVISLAGIKVCSPDGKVVLMAHALRRVSYATCEPSQSSFSFLARQPKGHFTQQFCHAFLAKSSEQRRQGCEMGRTSGGGALFRVHHQYRKLREEPHHQYRKLREEPHHSVDLMAYPCTRCGHLQTFKAEELNSIVGNAFRMAYAAQLQPAFQQVMQNNQQHQQTTPSEQQSFLWNRPGSLDYGMKGGNSLESGLPGTVPEEADSPTELNSCRRIADKPPPVKRLAMGTTPTEEELPPPLIITTKSIDIHDRLTDSPETKTSGATPPPAPPERSDSLNNRPEDGELKSAPWFQAGIPREITLEVLGQEPVGSFMVRESTSKPGCFALSLRVPHEFQPLGIAHYLILRTNKGYKIKGFTKEFRTLTALITHHSVMPELLPCPLSLSRYNPTYSQADTSRDFADIDSDPDYNTLADFRRMMADLNV